MTVFDLLSLMRAAPEFAMLRRADAPDTVDVYIGQFAACPQLADLPLAPVGADRHELLVLVPYRQIAERGYACHDDGAPLLALSVRRHIALPLTVALSGMPDDAVAVTGGEFDLGDEAYADIVRAVQSAEIGTGAGSNFVIRRTYQAQLDLGSTRARVAAGLAIFARLLTREQGAYWTFLVHSRDRTLVGATPERHVSLSGGVATMNPISGTLRYPDSGPSVAEVLRFLGDRKETDELSMVVDEELKMMAPLCPGGVRVRGPYLREMARLAHTEYTISGESPADVRDILAATMFAPTVVGSPLENACRIVAAYERRGRGYYGGVLALIGQRAGRRTLDSAICLRAANIDRTGRLAVDVGATIVRGSDPDGEAAETTTKAATLLAAVTGAAPPGQAGSPARPWLSDVRRRRLGDDPRVSAALAARNARLASFWFAGATAPAPVLDGRRLAVVDAEDAFTTMLAHQLRAVGARVSIHSYAEPLDSIGDRVDAVVLGPGPGDPRDRSDPKIATLAALTRRLLHERVPIFAVCLGHQVLASLVGLALRRKPVPTQGTQQKIIFDGRTLRVGCYNTFAAFSRADAVTCAVTGSRVTVVREAATGEVFGLRGPGLASVQFHLESILTQGGPELLGEMVGTLLDRSSTADLRCSA